MIFFVAESQCCQFFPFDVKVFGMGAKGFLCMGNNSKIDDFRSGGGVWCTLFSRFPVLLLLLLLLLLLMLNSLRFNNILMVYFLENIVLNQFIANFEIIFKNKGIMVRKSQ